MIMQRLYNDMQNDTAPRSAFLAELSESEVFSNSPQKDQERSSYRANSSLRLMNAGSTADKSDNGYGKTLRPRRNRTSTGKSN